MNSGRCRAMLMQNAAMSSHGKQRSSLGGVGTSCTAVPNTIQDMMKAVILAHNPQDPDLRRRLNATRLQGMMLSESRGKRCINRTDNGAWQTGTTLHQWKLTRARRGKAEQRASKPKEGTPHTSSMKCFFCKEKGHARKDCPKFSAWLAEKRTVGHGQSVNAIEEYGWIFALDHEHEEPCELIMIDSGASVHACPLEHGQETGLRKSSVSPTTSTSQRPPIHSSRSPPATAIPQICMLQSPLMKKLVGFTLFQEMSTSAIDNALIPIKKACCALHFWNCFA